LIYVVRLLGAVLVVTAATGFGLWKAGTYTQRAKELQQLLTSLEMLATEIAYAATPLPDAFRRIGSQVGGKIGHLLQETGSAVQRGDGLTAGEIFCSTLLKWNTALQLTPQDQQILIAFAHTLGNSDRSDQLKHIQLAVTRLSAEAVVAREEQARLGKMWKYLGALTGLAVVIIML
jgi:stage III sporulation protein AB